MFDRLRNAVNSRDIPMPEGVSDVPPAEVLDSPNLYLHENKHIIPDGRDHEQVVEDPDILEPADFPGDDSLDTEPIPGVEDI